MKAVSTLYQLYKIIKSSLQRLLTGMMLPQVIVNQHPPVHHPLDAHYYSVVDEPQLS
jgi:hypothetical protein